MALLRMKRYCQLILFVFFAHQTHAGLLENIAAALVKTCKDNKNSEIIKSIFHTHTISTISILDYLKRIVEHAKISSEELIVPFLLIKKHSEKTKIPITYYNIHRLIISAVVSSVKFYSDEYYSQVHYASVGGVSPQELLKLSLEFLIQLDWNLWVERETYNEALTMLSGEQSKRWRQLFARVFQAVHALIAN